MSVQVSWLLNDPTTNLLEVSSEVSKRLIANWHIVHMHTQYIILFYLVIVFSWFQVGITIINSVLQGKAWNIYRKELRYQSWKYKFGEKVRQNNGLLKNGRQFSKDHLAEYLLQKQ